MSAPILRATLTWNGAILKCNQPLKTRTALFRQNRFQELRLTFVPRLQQTAHSKFLSAAVLFPKGERLRYRLTGWELKKNGNLSTAFERKG